MKNGISFAASLGLLLACVVTVLGVLLLTVSPIPKDASAPLDEYAAQRAFQHVEALSAYGPRPIGSPAHTAAQAYLMEQLQKLGLEPQVQRAFSVSADGDELGMVENVLVRLPGSQTGGKAVLVVAHYDGAPTGPAAADDGAAVATLLEVLRAMQARPALRNDVIFLFSDGEEMRLLGARVFAQQHPWMADVGVVLNLEARGTNGLVYAFETGPHSAWAAQALADATGVPVANSLMADVYRQLPNDTDFTVFRERSLPGWNLAFIGNGLAYHTRLDSPQNLSLASLQHQGEYTLGLVQTFGMADLGAVPGTGEAIYFDLLGRTLVHYPSGLRWILLLSGLAVWGWLLALQWRRGEVRLGRVGWGVLVALGTVVLAGLAAWLGLLLSEQVDETSYLLRGRYNDIWYWGAALTFGLAVAWAWQRLALRWLWLQEAELGAAGLWWLASLGLCIAMPGATYVLQWPLLFVLGGLALQRMPALAQGWRMVLLWVATLPLWLLVAPLVWMLEQAMGAGMAYVSVALAGLIVSLLPRLPLGLDLPFARQRKLWLLPLMGAVLGVGLFSVAWVGRGYDQNRPWANFLMYIYDADGGQGYWATTTDAPDPWLKLVMPPEETTKDELSEVVSFFGRPMPVSPAPAAAHLPTSQVTLLENRRIEAGYELRLQVVPGLPGAVHFAVGEEETVVEILANGLPVTEREFVVWSPPVEGFELLLRVNGEQPLRLMVMDKAWGLPELPGVSLPLRPPSLMPCSSYWTDTTFVSRRYTFLTPQP